MYYNVYMNKKAKKKNSDYSIAEIKDMILRDAPEIEYGRYNITAPKIVMERLAEETGEPRSGAVTRFVIEDLEKKELKRKQKSLAKDLAMFNRESLEIIKGYDYSHIK